MLYEFLFFVFVLFLFLFFVCFFPSPNSKLQEKLQKIKDSLDNSNDVENNETIKDVQKKVLKTYCHGAGKKRVRDKHKEFFNDLEKVKKEEEREKGWKAVCEVVTGDNLHLVRLLKISPYCYSKFKIV